MNLKEMLLNTVDTIEDDQEFMEKEFAVVREYLRNNPLRESDIVEIYGRGLGYLIEEYPDDAENTIELLMYADTAGLETYDGNLTYVTYPVKWFLDKLAKLKYCDYDSIIDFFKEYMADDTEIFYKEAVKDGIKFHVKAIKWKECM